MIFKRQVQRYGRTPYPETPYQRAGQLWDERIGAARVQARNWRLAAFVSLALTGGLAAGPSNAGQRATFSLTGGPGQNVLLILAPPPALTSSLGDLIPVLALTLDGSPVRSIDAASGTLMFGVGGIIAVPADAPDGIYAADFDLTATYF